MKNAQSEELEKRFMRFGVSVIKLVQTHKEQLPFSVMDQVIRASTSVGANYAEAQNASSRADFRNKIYIAKKEAAETRYWLRIVSELTGSTSVDPQLIEIQEILLILQRITTKLREPSAT